MVLPSILTPPNVEVDAVGKLYPPVLVITPLVIVIVVPSTLTPPSTLVLEVGRVYTGTSAYAGNPATTVNTCPLTPLANLDSTLVADA